MLFRAHSLVACLAAVAVTQAMVSNPNIVGRQGDDLPAPVDSSTDSPSESTTSDKPSSTDASPTSKPTETEPPSTTTGPPTTSTTTSSTPTSTTDKPTSSTPKPTSSPSSSSKDDHTSSTSSPSKTTPPPNTNQNTSPTTTSTTSSSSPTNSASLTNNGNTNGGGLSTKTKNTIIGAVVGVGGFIVLAALALVAYRIWGRKKVDEDSDGLMSYQIGSVGPEKTGSSSGTNAGNPFQSTLETYHNPARNVNASSNF